jgi:transcription elongation factor GreA
MSDIVYLTKPRLLAMQKELEVLTTVKRTEIAQKIADARSHGDLSENADYDAAKEEQGLLELQISKLGALLSKAQVITSDQFPTDKVYILSKVKLKDLDNKEIIEYIMVSDSEADFMENKISVSSLVGKALLGKKVGELVEIKVPAGTLKYEVLDIGKSDL